MQNQPKAHEPPPVAECPPEDQLVELAEERLSGTAAEAVRTHAEHCPTCSLFLIGLSNTTSGTAGTTGSNRTTERGLPAQFVAEFRLLRPLGHGAMGEVFLARDTFLDRLVAIKFLSTVGTSASARERFYVEARAVARLQHPNVVTLYRAGEDQGRRYLVSEYVRGQSLERQPKPLPWAQVVDIGLGLARGLAAAHQRGVLHRDLKPANAMMTKGGEIKLLDFGLAKLIELLPESVQPAGAVDGQADTISPGQSEALNVSNLAITRSGALLGTPLYMAPETWRGEPATTQTDIYSLGALLFELCTGRPPHHAETAVALGFRVIGNDAAPLATAAPGVDARLAAVVDRCLQRDPAKRFASGEEVREALESIAAKNPPISRRIAIAGIAVLLSVLAIVAGFTIARDRQAKKQAELAQRLGQEIAAMEWLLRSARQLPLHNLEHEKDIVRRRMSELKTRLDSYGNLGSGLAHYALGRGHMALHEYPQALAQLQLAIQQGNQSAELHYALGFVLGQHFEQAMYEARLAGGGDWAKKQLKDIEPKYLAPAIASLQRSRSMKLDAPQYLEALLAYYQRDYDVALKQAAAALRDAPWLYEAAKLSGDVHLERALQTRDSGHYEDAEQEFASAVKSYEAAAAVGQSDGEVYEGLAEAWVRQIEMKTERGQPTETAYAVAVAASDKIIAADPQSIAGRLKKGYAALMTMASLGGGQSSDARVKECLVEAQAVLAKQPENPYASDVGADCYTFAAGSASTSGGKPEPLFRHAFALLEPAIRRYPHFLWGLNDLASAYLAYGLDLQLRGDPKTRDALESSLRYEAMAIGLDATYLVALQNALYTFGMLISTSGSEQDLPNILSQADNYYEKCMKINNQFQQCNINYLLVYARASQRFLTSGNSPQPPLKKAREILTAVRKIGGSFLDVEQNAALTYLVEADEAVKRRQDPSAAFFELQAALARCFAINVQDAMCRTLAAQADWVRSDWLASKNQPVTASLEAALAKAVLATQSPEEYPDAWRTLAEAHLRLAHAEAHRPAGRDAHIAAGLAAVEKVFAINPNHAQGRATEGALQLIRAQSARELTTRGSAAQAAVRSLEQSLKSDPFLTHAYAALLEVARALQSPTN